MGESVLVYLSGSESRNQLCYVVPVNGLGCSPQRAQNHVQDQDVVVIGEVVVVQTEAAHFCKRAIGQQRMQPFVIERSINGGKAAPIIVTVC